MGLKYFVTSLTAHLLFLAIIIVSFTSTSDTPVIENSNQQDVISAVILGDTEKSHIIAPPQNMPAKKEPLPEPPKLAKPITKPVAIDKAEAIAIKPAPPKPVKKKPNLEADKKLKELLGKSLLSDIKTTREKQTLKQKQLQKKFQQAIKEQAEQSMRQQLIDDDLKLQSEKMRQAQGQVNKYKALILQAISTNWIVPPQINRKLTLSVMIRLAPGGMVLDVQITKTSGDPALDSSVRAAVIKASPLPVPGKTAEFEVFRQFILKVKPENILASDATNTKM